MSFPQHSTESYIPDQSLISRNSLSNSTSTPDAQSSPSASAINKPISNQFQTSNPQPILNTYIASTFSNQSNSPLLSSSYKIPINQQLAPQQPVIKPQSLSESTPIVQQFSEINRPIVSSLNQSSQRPTPPPSIQQPIQYQLRPQINQQSVSMNQQINQQPSAMNRQMNHQSLATNRQINHQPVSIANQQINQQPVSMTQQPIAMNQQINHQPVSIANQQINQQPVAMTQQPIATNRQINHQPVSIANQQVNQPLQKIQQLPTIVPQLVQQQSFDDVPLLTRPPLNSNPPIPLNRGQFNSHQSLGVQMNNMALNKPTNPYQTSNNTNFVSNPQLNQGFQNNNQIQQSYSMNQNQMNPNLSNMNQNRNQNPAQNQLQNSNVQTSQQTSMLSTAYNQTQFNQNQSNPTPSTYTPAQAPQFLQYQESVPDVFNSSPHQSFYSQNDIGQRQPQPQPLGFHPIVNMPFNLLASPPNAQEISKTSVEGLIPFHVSVSKHPSASCDSRYKRCTLQQVPATQALLSKSKLPFGLIVSPYKQADGNCEIPIINPETIVRCRRCRTYINPWVQFVDNGMRWKCNLCFLSNDIPAYYDWNAETKQAANRMVRPELTHSIVEYVAPQEYMVRPPQPVVFLFLIDVSHNALNSGVLHSISEALLASLDNIPNKDGRTKIGLIAVDSALHFYNLNNTLSDPSILIVSDLEDVHLPIPYDLLVPLSDSRPLIESALKKLPNIYANTRQVKNNLGKALAFAFKLVSPTGGKLIVFQSTLPNHLDGALKQRDDPKIYNTSKESQALHPSTDFYKITSVEHSRSQIGIDLFLFGGQYLDVATLGCLSKHSGGSIYYYPNFTAQRREDVIKFKTELVELLTRPLGLEAVLRVRASKGIRMDAFYGNFFLRSTDLLALPNLSPHHTYVAEMSIEEPLVGSVACFQTALLHTSDCGERRIRVLTMALPVSNNLTDIFTGADPFAITAFLAKKAVDRVLSARLEDAKEALVFKLIDILTAYKMNFTTSSQTGQLLVSHNMKHLPALILGLLKHESLRQFTQVLLDTRAHKLSILYTYSTELIINMIYPRLYSLHDIQDTRIDPVAMHLSSEMIDRCGLYMMDAGTDLYFYMSKGIHAHLCKELFGYGYDELISGKCGPLVSCSPYSEYICRFVKICMKKEGVTPSLWLMRETDVSSKSAFLSGCIEDKMGDTWSYPLFLSYLKEQVSK